MQINDRIKEITSTIKPRLKYVKTEEATKTSFVMPFISALGYDVFNPLEVVPEFTADVGTKKGEKVDYAIKKDGKIIMLVECKQCGTDLSTVHKDQLYRYFSVTESRFAVLTNGIIYHFYSDIDAPNKMDDKPFFEFDIINHNENHIEELNKFTKTAFDLGQIVSTASNLKYTNAVKRMFFEELNKPTESFIKFWVSKVYSGKQTHNVIDQFTTIVKSAVRESISEIVSSRLQSALKEEKESLNQEKSQEQPVAQAKQEEEGKAVLERELEAYNIVKAIARNAVSAKRISLHHGKFYSSIVLDDSNRKPICKLYLHGKRKMYIGLINDNKQENRVLISALDDIFNYADAIHKTAKSYSADEEKPAHQENVDSSNQIVYVEAVESTPA